MVELRYSEIQGADRGLVLNGDTHYIGHEREITSKPMSLRKIAYDDYGHISNSIDLDVGRGINIASDNVIGHENTISPSTTAGVYKIEFDKYGHIIKATPITADQWTFTLANGTKVVKNVYLED